MRIKVSFFFGNTSTVIELDIGKHIWGPEADYIKNYTTSGLLFIYLLFNMRHKDDKKYKLLTKILK